MTPTPVEELLRELAQRTRGDGVLPADVVRRVRRHHRRRQLLAGVGAAATVALAVLLPAELLAHRDQTGHRPAPPAGSTATPTAHPTTAARPHFTPLPAGRVRGGAREPASVLALIGAGAERLARVDTATGRVTTWLQNNGSQALLTFSPDLSTAYQPDLVHCRAAWTAIDTETGAKHSAFDELGGPLEVAIAADPARIAYLAVGKQQRVPNGTGGSIAAGCPTAPHALVVTDSTTETTETYPIAHYDESLYPAFDGTGTRLAFVGHRRVRILDLNTDTTLAESRLLTPTLHHGCTQNKPLWRPGSDSVLVAEQCGQDSAIVGYDAGTGDETYRHAVSGASIIGSFDVDASGEHIVYASSSLAGLGAGSYAVEPGGDRQLIDDAYQVAW